MATQAPSNAPRRRFSTAVNFGSGAPSPTSARRPKPFPGGDRFAIKDLTDEESEGFWDEHRDGVGTGMSPAVVEGVLGLKLIREP